MIRAAQKWFIVTKSTSDRRAEPSSPQVGTGFRGLGDDTAGDSTDTSFLGGSFLGGSALTAFVLGLGVIIAVKTMLSPSRSSAPKKKWAAGAWRSADYEDPNAPIFSDKELKKLLKS